MARKSKKDFKPSSLDALVYGSSNNSNPFYQQALENVKEADRRNFKRNVVSSVTSTEADVLPERSSAMAARAAADRARQAADQKRQEEEAAAKSWKGSIISAMYPDTSNVSGAIAHAAVDPFYEIALSNSRTNNEGTGVLRPYEVLAGTQANVYRNLRDAASGKRPLDLARLSDSVFGSEGLEQEVKTRRANQQERVGDSTVLGVVSGLARLPVDLLSGGGSAAAEDYNHQIENGVSDEAARKHAAAMGGLNLAFNTAIPGGKVVSEAGITAAKKVAPAFFKSLTPNAAKSADRLGAEELAKHQLGTAAIMTTYGGAALGLNKYTATFSDDEAQRKFANDQLPENAGEVIKELGVQALTGAAVGTAFGGYGSVMTRAKAKAESLAEIQNTMDDLARQTKFGAGTKPDNTVQPKAKVEPESNVRYGPLDQRPATEQLLFDATTAQGEGQLFPNAPRGNVKDNALTPPRFLTDKPQIGREQPDMFGGRREYTKANPEVIEPEAPTSNVRDNLYRIQRQGQLFDSMPKQPDGTDTGVVYGPERNPDPNRPLFGEDALPVPDSAPELGTLTNRTLGEQRAADMAPHIEAATKLEQQAAKQEQKAQASELKKAKTKWNADKRKAMLEARGSMLDLPEAERIKALADVNREWLSNNPEPTVESLAAAKRATEEAAPEVVDTAAPEAAVTAVPETKATNGVTLEDLRKIKPDATEADVAAANKGNVDSFTALVRETQGEPTGLAQKGEEPTNRASLEDIEAELKGSATSGEVRTLNALQRNGHVKVVANESLLPEGASRMEGSKHGWFEGDTAYIVADKLEKGNVVKGMLDVAGHEVKHGVDLQGKPYQYSAISNKIIGTDANKRIVAKIEKLAEQGDTTAKQIIDIAKENPKTYELEVAAHALNRANLQRSKAGAFAGVSKDLLSTVRTSAKALIGSDNVNINDLHYLGKRLLAEVADSNGKLGRAGESADGLGMIVGKNHPRYQEFKDAGKVWTGPDGKERFVLSDASTKLNKDSVLTLLGGHKTVTIGSLLKNNESIKGYGPELARRKVIIDPELSGRNAYATGKTIGVSKDLVKRAVASAKGEGELISTLLHETQHHVQRIEDHARGASVKDYMNPEALAEYEAYTFAVDGLLDNIKELKKVDRELYDRFVKEDMSYKEVGDILSANPATRALGNDIKLTNEIAESSKGAADKALDEAHVKYRQTLGEQEAQLTERTRTLEQDELNPFPFDRDSTDPRPSVFNQESTVTEKTRIAGRNADVLVKDTEGVVAHKTDGTTERVPSWDATGREMSEAGGMAYKGLKQDVADVTKSKVDAAKDFLAKGFFLNGKLGEKFMELVRQRNRDAAMMGEHAQSLRVAIGNAVDSLMSNEGISKEAANKYITEKSDLLAKLPTVEAREQWALEMAKNDPIMAPVIDGFRQINDATRVLIRQELEANKNITTARLKELKAMWENQWKYSTRSYAAFQGEAGVKYAKSIIGYVADARKKIAQDRKLTANESKYLNIYNRATQLIINSDLTMPKDLSKITDGKRESLYDAWVPGEGYAARKGGLVSRAIEQGKTKAEAELEAITTLTNELEQYRPRSEDAAELQAKADYIAESILGLRDSSDGIAQVYRGGKADDSIMKHRTDIPKEIRDLLGEIDDPGLRLSLTLLKQGELIAGNKMLKAIKNQGIEEGWIAPRAEAYKNKNMGHTIQEDYLGTLKGMVTTPEIATVLNASVDFINQSGDMLTRALVDADSGFGGVAGKVDKTLQLTARGWKRVTVAYNPYSHGRDFAGSGITLMANGVLLKNPLKQLELYGAGGKLALENIVGTAKGGSATYSALFDDAVRYGLFESVKVHELRTAFGDSLRKEINPSNSAAILRKMQTVVGRTDATVIQVRAMTDAWTKIPIWLERVDTLSKYYEAQGIKKTMSEIKAEAGRDMRRTTVTQDQVPAFAKYLETRGITTFLPYYIAATRALKNNFEMGYTDIVRGLTEAKTPEARNLMLASGTRRLVGSGLAVTTMTVGIQKLADAWNGDGKTEEERKKSLESVDALKKLMFPNARYGEVLYVGKNEKGEPVFINATAVDPYGPVMDIVRIIANPDISNDEKANAAMEAAFDTLTSLNKGPVDIAKFVMGVATGKTPHKGETKIDRMAPTLSSYIRERLTGNGFKNLSRNDAQNFLQILSDYTPGLFNPADTNNQIKADAKNIGKVVMWSGGRMESANVGAAIGGTGAELKDFRKDTRDTVNEMVSRGDSPENIFDYVAKRAEDEQKMTIKLLDTYNAMTVGLRYPQSKAVGVMRAAKLDARDIAKATKGKAFDSVYEMLNDPKGPLSDKSFTTWKQQRARRKNGDEKAAAKEAKELMNKFRVLSLKSGAIQEYRDEEEDNEDDN